MGSPGSGWLARMELTGGHSAFLPGRLVKLEGVLEGSWTSAVLEGVSTAWASI